MIKAASELGFTPVSRPRVYGGPSVPGPNFHVAESEIGDKGHIFLEDYLSSRPKTPVMK
jgi:hypothetical protein